MKLENIQTANAQTIKDIQKSLKTEGKKFEDSQFKPTPQNICNDNWEYMNSYSSITWKRIPEIP